MADLPPLLCTECDKPIEPIGSAVSLRFTVLNDKANWAQRYEHRPLPGTFHGGCAESAFRRNAETFNNPDPWTRLGRWHADPTWGQFRSHQHGKENGGRYWFRLKDERSALFTGIALTLDSALVAALEKLS